MRSLTSRCLAGAIAGIGATAVMTFTIAARLAARLHDLSDVA